MIVSQILSQFFVSSRNLFDIYVLKVEESIAEISTELIFLGDSENPGQLRFERSQRYRDAIYKKS